MYNHEIGHLKLRHFNTLSSLDHISYEQHIDLDKEVNNKYKLNDIKIDVSTEIQLFMLLSIGLGLNIKNQTALLHLVK